MTNINQLMIIIKNELYSIILGIFVLISVIFLFFQPPFLFYSPDVSYHAAKILRVMNGEFLIDPVSGFFSLYPPFFHIIMGQVNNLVLLDPISLMRDISILNFLGLIILTYFFAYVYTNKRSLAAISAAATGITFYEFCAKYILLVNPYNTALLFALLGLILVLYGITQHKNFLLLFGLFFLGISSCIWYYNFIFIVSVLIILGLIYLKDKDFFQKKIFTDIKFPLISAIVIIILLIFAFFSVIQQSLISYFLLGNERFLDSLYPFAAQNSLIWLVNPFILSILFFCIIVPINFLFFIYPCYLLFLKKVKFERTDIFLFTIAVLIFFISIVVHYYEPDISRIIRIQYISHLIFMVISISFISRKLTDKTQAVVLKLIFFAGCIIILLTAIHDPYGLIISGPDKDTQDLISYIDSLPNHTDTRIFMTDTAIKEVYEFVPFKSYTYHRRYGVWDSSQGKALQSLLGSYDAIMLHDPEWRNIMCQEKTELMVFDCYQKEPDYALAEYYIKYSTLIWNNDRWLVLKPEIDRNCTVNSI